MEDKAKLFPNENRNTASSPAKDTSARTAKPQGENAGKVPAEKRVNYAFYPKKDAENGEKTTEKAGADTVKKAVPYVKKADRMKAASSGAAPAANGTGAKDHRADSPIPSEPARKASAPTDDSGFLKLDFSSDEPIYPVEETADPYATAGETLPQEASALPADGMGKPTQAEIAFEKEREEARRAAAQAAADKRAREAEKKALLAALTAQKKQKDDEILGAERHDTRMTAGKGAYDGSEDYLKSRFAAGADIKMLKAKEDGDKLRIANEEIEKEIERRQKEEEERKDRHTKKPKKKDDDFFRVDEESPDRNEEEALTDKLTDSERKTLQRGKEREDRRDERKRRRLFMRVSDFDSFDESGTPHPKVSQNDKPLDEALLEDYLVKRFAAIRVDNDRQRSNLTPKNKRKLRKKEKAEAINDAVASLAALGITDEKTQRQMTKSISSARSAEEVYASTLRDDGFSGRNASLNERLEKAKQLAYTNEAIKYLQSIEQEEAENRADRQSLKTKQSDERRLDREEKKVNPESYLREYEEEVSPAVRAKAEGDFAKETTEAKLTAILLALEEARDVAVEAQEILSDEAEEAQKIADNDSYVSIQARRRAKIERERVEKIKGHSDVSESYRKQVEREALREEKKAGIDAKKAVEAEAVAQMKAELLEQITEENEARLFALASAEAAIAAKAERTEAERILEIEKNAVASSLAKAEQAGVRLATAQARLSLPLSKAEKLILEKELKQSAETQLRSERDAIERSERVAVDEVRVALAIAKEEKIEAERLERSARMLAEKAETFAQQQEKSVSSADPDQLTEAEERAVTAREEADRAFAVLKEEAVKAAKAAKNVALLEARVAREERLVAERAARGALEEAEIAEKEARLKEEQAIVALKADKREAERLAKNARFVAARKAESAVAQKNRAAEAAQKELKLSAFAAGVEEERLARADRDAIECKERADELSTLRQEREERLAEKTAFISPEEALSIMDAVAALREQRLSEIERIDMSVLEDKPAPEETKKVGKRAQKEDEPETVSLEKTAAEQRRETRKVRKAATEEADKANIERSESRKEEAYALTLESRLAKQKEQQKKEEVANEAALREDGERRLAEAKDLLADAIRVAEKKATESYYADNNERLTGSVARKKTGEESLPGAGLLKKNSALEARVKAERVSRKAHRAAVDSARAEAEVKVRLLNVEEIVHDNEERLALHELSCVLGELKTEIAAAEKAGADAERALSRATAARQTAKEKYDAAEKRKDGAAEKAERILAERAVAGAKFEWERADRDEKQKTFEQRKAAARLATLKAREASVYAEEEQRVAAQNAGESLKNALYHALLADRVSDEARADAEAQERKYREETDRKEAECREKTAKAAKAAYDLAVCEENEADLEAEEAIRSAEAAESEAKKCEEAAIGQDFATESAEKGEKISSLKALRLQREKADRARDVANVEKERAERAEEERKIRHAATKNAEQERLLAAEAEFARIKARAEIEGRNLAEREARLLSRFAKLSENEKRDILDEASNVAGLSASEFKKRKRRNEAELERREKERKELENMSGSSDAEEYLNLFLQGKRFYPEVDDSMREYVGPINNKVRKLNEKAAQNADLKRKIAEERENLKRYMAECAAALEKERVEHRRAEDLAEDEIVRAKKFEDAAKDVAERAAKDQAAAFLRAEEVKRYLSEQTDRDEKNRVRKLLKEACAEVENAIRYAEEQALLAEKAEAETEAKVKKADRLKKDNALLERRALQEKEAEYAALEQSIEVRYDKIQRVEADNAEKKALAAEEAAEELLGKQRRATDRKEKDEALERQAKEAESRREEARLEAKLAAYEADLAQAKAREATAKVERIAAEDAAKEARLLVEAAKKTAILQSLKAQNTKEGSEADAEKARKEAEAEVGKAEKFARQEEEKAEKALKAEAEAIAAVAAIRSKESARRERLAAKECDRKKREQEAAEARARQASKAEKSEQTKQAKQAKKEAEIALRQLAEAENRAKRDEEKKKKAEERAGKAEEEKRQRDEEAAARSEEKARIEAEKEAEKQRLLAEREKERAEKETALKLRFEALLRPVSEESEPDGENPAPDVRKADSVEDYFFDYVEQDQKSKAAAKAIAWERKIAEKEYEEAAKIAEEARKEADLVNAEVKEQSKVALAVLVASREAARKVEQKAGRKNVNAALAKERKAEKAGEQLEKITKTGRRAELTALKSEAIAAIRKERVENLLKADEERIRREEDAQKLRLALADAKQAETLAANIRKDADGADERARIADENCMIAENRIQSGVPGMSRESLEQAFKVASEELKNAEKQARTLASAVERAEISCLAKQAKADRVSAVIAAKAARLVAEQAKIAEMSADLKAQALTGDGKAEAENSLKFLSAESERAETFAKEAEAKAVKAMKAEAETAQRAARADRLEADRIARLASAEAIDARNVANAAVTAASNAEKADYAEAERTAKYAIAEAERREKTAIQTAKNAAFRAQTEKDAESDLAGVEEETARYFDNEKQLSLERAKMAAKRMAEKEATLAGIAAKLTPDERKEFFDAVSSETRRINDAVAESREQARRQADHIESQARSNEYTKKITEATKRREKAYRDLLEARKERQLQERELKSAKADAAYAAKAAQEAEKAVSEAEESEKEEAEREAYFALRESKRLERVLMEEEQKAERAAIAVSLAEKELSAAVASAESAFDAEEKTQDQYVPTTWNDADKTKLNDLANGRTAEDDKTAAAEEFLLSYSAKEYLTGQLGGKERSRKQKAEKAAIAGMPSVQENANAMAILDAVASGDLSLMTDKKQAEVRIAKSYFENVIREMCTEIDFFDICLSEETRRYKKAKGDAKLDAAAEIVDLERAACEKYFDILAFGKEKHNENGVSRFVPKAVARIRRFNEAVKKLEALDHQKHAYADLKIPAAILDGSAYRPMISSEYGREESESEKKRNVSAHAFRTDMSLIRARYNYGITALNAKIKNERYTYSVDNLKQSFGKAKLKKLKKQMRKERERALRAELSDNERYETALSSDVFTTPFKKRNVDRMHLEKLRTMLIKALSQRDEINRRLLTLYTGEALIKGTDVAVSLQENGKIKDAKSIRSFADTKYAEILKKAKKQAYKNEWGTAKSISKLYIPDKDKTLLFNLLNRKTELIAAIETTGKKIRVYRWRGATKKQALHERRGEKRELRNVNAELRERLRRAENASRTRPGIRWFR